MDNTVLEKQKKAALLASAFAVDHPDSGIRSTDDLYRYLHNNPGEVEGWIKNKTDIPIPQRTVQELAFSFQAAYQLDEMLKHPYTPPEQTKPNDVGNLLGSLLAAPAAFLPDNGIKLGEYALTQPSPDVSLYQFVPTQILADADFQQEISQGEAEKVKELQLKNPQKKLSQKEIKTFLDEERHNIRMNALNRYASNDERAEKVRVGRENDIYLKDAQGRIVGEKIFKDKKNKTQPYLDPIYTSYQSQKRAAIAEALQKRKEDKKNGIKPRHNEADTRRIVELQYDGHFKAMFPEKAEAYAKQDVQLEFSLKTLSKAEKRLEKKDRKAASKEQAAIAAKATTTTPASAPTPAKVSTKTPAQPPKTAKGYQHKWNKETLEKAVHKGYDRFDLSRKIRDLKVWKTRAWQEGKKQIFPNHSAMTTASHKGDATPTHTEERRDQNQPDLSRFRLRNFRGNRGESFWNRTRGLSTFNKSAGKKVGSKVAQKAVGAAGKKAAQQLATKAVQQLATKALLEPHVLIAIGIVLGIIILIIMVITIVTLITGKGGDFGEDVVAPPIGNPGGPNKNPVPNLALDKTVSDTVLPAPAEITYTISYDFLASTTDTTIAVAPSDVTIYDTVPENTDLIADKTTGNYTLAADGKTISWALSEPENAALTSFSFTVMPTTTDITVSNSAWAEAASSSNPNPPPGSGAKSPNSCTNPKEGTGYCAYDYLLPYFNNQSDLALTASLICNLESGSNPFAANKVCPDYSIGLFQINLVAHCGGAFSPPPACTVLDSPLRDACEQRFLDPAENIQYAYQLYLSGGTGWTANKWSTYPAAKGTLDSCGSI